MAPTRPMPFTASTSGADVLEHIKELFETDRKVRKREIQAVADVIANQFVQDELSELVKTLGGETTYFRNQDFEWLSEIMSSVALEADKLVLVKNELEKKYASTIEKKYLAELKTQTINILEREFKKVRNLKQAYYYRNRSVRALINYLESEEGADLLRIKIPTEASAKAWFEKIRERFSNYEVGEKFTRNSYLSEFEAFIADAWSELPLVKLQDLEKSFNEKIKSVLPKMTKSESTTLNQAYKQLFSYYDNHLETKTRARIDEVFDHGAVEFKAVKSQGILAYYKAKNNDLKSLKEIEARVLASSFEHENLPDIATQITEDPQLLIIKCLGKPNATTIADFERFVREALL